VFDPALKAVHDLFPADVDGDGRDEIVFTDAEIPGGKVWWMENLDGRGRKCRRHDIYTPGAGPRRGAYHSLFVGDVDGDGALDVFSCEMEHVGGDRPPRYFIWENVDGQGGTWQERVILDANLAKALRRVEVYDPARISCIFGAATVIAVLIPRRFKLAVIPLYRRGAAVGFRAALASIPLRAAA